MTWARLKAWLALAVVAALGYLYARAEKAKAETAKTVADFAQRKAVTAEKRTERVLDAQDAARRSAVNSEEELQNVLSDARRTGRRNHFESD